MLKLTANDAALGYDVNFTKKKVFLKAALRVLKAKKTLKLIQRLPREQALKTKLIAGKAIPQLVYGAEANGIPAADLPGFRASVVRALFGAKRLLRCVDVVLTVIVPGHLVDPKQATDYKTFTFVRRLLKLRPELHQLWKEVWAKRCSNGAKTIPGLVGNVLRIARTFGWVPLTPFSFGTDFGEFHLYNSPKGPWHHDLREAIRRKQHPISVRNMTLLGKIWLALPSIPLTVLLLLFCCVLSTSMWLSLNSDLLLQLSLRMALTPIDLGCYNPF